ncbi:histidine kinase N-terminal domain-containing protein [Rossellomorea sp. BNER]|uniref:histidine kinase N-terminal domain-containing protein n=1 Tax=Rossellomorea sp. BNER TaxID=2962031 RepID=UPI003AF2FA38|nr:ATP-binding protein [Rossellomorea sp. BNER]
MAQLKHDVIHYFVQNQEKLISNWHHELNLTPHNAYAPKQLYKNSEIIYEQFLKGFTLPHEQIDSYVKETACTIAEQRFQSDTNIGEFVYNLNLGRTEILKQFHQINNNLNEVQDSIDKINYFFDKFSFYTVSHYTNLKNELIEKKDQYIDSNHEDRLSLLGQMTSSFVHEFRNPLTSINGFVQLLRSEYPSISYLDIIASELEQLNFRISQFLLLSKKGSMEKEKSFFKLNELVEQVLTFLYPRILEVNVNVETSLQEDVTIEGWKDEFRQVIINIIFNAIDVLDSIESKRKIWVNTEILNSFVILRISNNGPKIPEDIQSTIFEPFVTSKTSGTGLGLFVCKEIVDRHGGDLSCSSNDYQTSFIIHIPIHAQ